MALTQVSRGLLSTSIVDNGNATAITIDSSENVLVGMDSASTTVDGLYLRPGTNSGINASNSHALTLNRRTNDGTIVKFDKDGLPVGLISTVAGRLGIGTGDAGLFFDDDNNRIGPVTLASGTPVDSDGLLDLGYSGARYKDLYLSSKVRLQYPGNSYYARVEVDSSTNLIFGAGPNGSERMRISSDGSLSVGGVLNAGLTDNGFFVGGNDLINVYSVNSSTSSSTYHVYDNGGAAYKFYVNYTGTINATNTTISGISDIRWKENIRDLDDGLAKVMQLKPRKFDWKQGKGKDVTNDRGFIAQEFEAVFPDLIDEWIDPAPEGEEPYKAVRADLIPTLVKAIQEQQATITALTARIETLENN